MESKIQVTLLALLGIVIALVVTTDAAGCTPPTPCLQKSTMTCEQIKEDTKVVDYKCTCVPGFMGKNCSKKIKPCDPNPCQRGAKCNVTSLGLKVTDYSCDCAMWWTAQDCSRHDVSLTILVATCIVVVVTVLFIIISFACNMRKKNKSHDNDHDTL